MKRRCRNYSQLPRFISLEKLVLAYNSLPLSLPCFLDLRLRASKFTFKISEELWRADPPVLVGPGVLHT